VKPPPFSAADRRFMERALALGFVIEEA